MADTKISSLAELDEAPSSTDEFVIVDKSDTTMGATGTNKRIKAQYLTIEDATASVKGKATLVEGQTHDANAKTTPVDADELGLVDSAASWVLKKLTILGLKLAIYAGIKPAEGTMWNGKISPTVTSNNITLALKTLAGNNPSASEPIYITLGGAVRTITSALSVTLNAGTNWCASGSAELATKEIDYFAYLGYNTTDGVVIGFSRIPFATQYSAFSTTTTIEKYLAVSTRTNAAATDAYAVIGRFAATLSAGAGYTWSVPTYTPSNLIQRPIYNTRALSYLPIIYNGITSPTYSSQLGQYIIDGNKVKTSYSMAVSGGTPVAAEIRIVSPFTAVCFSGPQAVTGIGKYLDSGVAHYIDMIDISNGNNYFTHWQYNGGNTRTGTTLSNGDDLKGTIEFYI